MKECEELFKIVQRNRDLRLDFVGGSRLQAARMMHTCQACQKLKSRVSYCTTGQKFETGQAICSLLELATQPSREVKSPEHPVWEKLTFHIPSHPTIYIPIGSSDVRIFGPRALPCSLFTPHPLESHIERKPPHLLPYKL